MSDPADRAVDASTSDVERRLLAAGHALPVLPSTGHSYLRIRRADEQLYVAGQTPKIDGELAFRGLCGVDVDLDTARRAAELCAINSLAAIATDADLDALRCLLKVTVFVAGDPRFDKQAVVADAASDLLVLALGERGRHARTAIGVAGLPCGAPVEIEVTAWCPPAVSGQRCTPGAEV